MKRTLVLILTLALALPAGAHTAGNIKRVVTPVDSAPTLGVPGTCTPATAPVQFHKSTGNHYTCQGDGSWALDNFAAGPGGGGGGWTDSGAYLELDTYTDRVSMGLTTLGYVAQDPGAAGLPTLPVKLWVMGDDGSGRTWVRLGTLGGESNMELLGLGTGSSILGNLMFSDWNRLGDDSITVRARIQAQETANDATRLEFHTETGGSMAEKWAVEPGGSLKATGAEADLVQKYGEVTLNLAANETLDVDGLNMVDVDSSSIGPFEQREISILNTCDSAHEGKVLALMCTRGYDWILVDGQTATTPAGGNVVLVDGLDFHCGADVPSNATRGITLVCRTGCTELAAGTGPCWREFAERGLSDLGFGLAGSTQVPELDLTEDYDWTGAHTIGAVAVATTADLHTELHAASHSDAGADELTTEDQATAATAVQGLLGDGSGGWSLTELATPGDLPVGANPSATVGLTATNGSASTFLRSDGAPALDQSISPLWTGNHYFGTVGSASGGEIHLDSVNKTVTQQLSSPFLSTGTWWFNSFAGSQGSVPALHGSDQYAFLFTQNGDAPMVAGFSERAAGRFAMNIDARGTMRISKNNAIDWTWTNSLDEVATVPDITTHAALPNAHHAQLHAASHADGAADELLSENLATAATNAQGLLGDGAGAWALTDLATEAELTTHTNLTDAHHTELHAASHADAGGDELTADDLATAATAAQALMGDGSGGLTPVDVTTEAELTTHAGLPNVHHVPDGTGVDTIQDEGVGVAQQATLNFLGAGVTCVDNPGSSRTDCTVTSGGGGEANTGSNVPTDGVGVYDGMNLTVLEFRGVASVDEDHLTVTLDDTDNDIDLAVLGAPAVLIDATKDTAGTINAGELVYQSGADVGAGIQVELADADGSGTMPAIGVAAESFTNATTGKVVVFGPVTANTTGLVVGASIYVDTTPGGFTDTRPTGAATAVQKIGTVAVVGASGTLYVSGANRSNDVPNRMPDNLVRIADDGDLTKVAMFQASGITTGTTRTVTLADQDVSLAPGTTYAATANGVTNGDTHDHAGGDGGTVDHTNLNSIGSNTHAQIDTHLGSSSNPHLVTCAQTTGCVQSAITSAGVTFENLNTNGDVGFGAAQVPQGSLTAALAGPTFTGDPKAPTPSSGDNDTSLATTAYVQGELPANPQKAATVLDAASSMEFTVWYTDVAITLADVTCVLVGTTPSVPFNIKHHSDRSNAGNGAWSGTQTCNDTTTGDSVSGADFSSFTDATVPAGSFLWVEVGTVTGTADEFHLTIEYTED